MANLYSFRSGHSVKNADAQSIGQELERIRAEKGQLTPAAVVDAAEADPNSPLRAAFEWDNATAAREHRLAQARRLIVSVRIVNSPITTQAPAFVSVRTPEKGREYLPTIEAMDDNQIRARILDEVAQFIEGMRRRYAHFQQVGDMLDRLKRGVG